MGSIADICKVGLISLLSTLYWTEWPSWWPRFVISWSPGFISAFPTLCLVRIFSSSLLPNLGWDHLSQAGSEWLEVSAGGCGDCLCLTEGRVETQQTQSSLLLSNNLSRLGSGVLFPLSSLVFPVFSVSILIVPWGVLRYLSSMDLHVGWERERTKQNNKYSAQAQQLRWTR